MTFGNCKCDLATAEETEHVATNIVRVARKVLEAECCTVYLLSRENSLRIAGDDGAIRGPARDMELEIVDAPGRGFTGFLAKTDQPSESPELNCIAIPISGYSPISAV
jgi:hypothetical protein